MMPEIRNKDSIRKILSSERPWSAYALGDLEPPLFEKTSWIVSDDQTPAIALLFRAFETPVLFTHGSTSGIDKILKEIDSEKRMFLSVKGDILDLMQDTYSIRDKQLMLRMVHHGDRVSCNFSAVRLLPDQIDKLQKLYDDGASTGEAPDFFADYMVEQGSFFGVFDGDDLVAAAGTHLIASSESIAAVGCVYTRRDHRGEGLGTVVTGAVVADLIRRGIDTIVLNVKKTNTAAIKVYERLGFKAYCEFYEGLATK